MKIIQIEAALRKQIAFRKEAAFLMRTDVVKDALMDAGMVIICGLSMIYTPESERAEDKIVKLYDINLKQFRKYAGLYFKHIDRAAVVIASYGIDIKAPNFYKLFADKFWITHNEGAKTEPFRTGVMLSHILSSRREYNVFLNKHVSHFTEDDFTSFFIFNKAQLTKNYLRQKIGKAYKEKYVDAKDLGY
jgi:hypothetical protein